MRISEATMPEITEKLVFLFNQASASARQGSFDQALSFLSTISEELAKDPASDKDFCFAVELRKSYCFMDKKDFKTAAKVLAEGPAKNLVPNLDLHHRFEYSMAVGNSYWKAGGDSAEKKAEPFLRSSQKLAMEIYNRTGEMSALERALPNYLEFLKSQEMWPLLSEVARFTLEIAHHLQNSELEESANEYYGEATRSLRQYSA